MKRFGKSAESWYVTSHNHCFASRTRQHLASALRRLPLSLSPTCSAITVLCPCHFNNYHNHFSKTTALWRPSRGEITQKKSQQTSPDTLYNHSESCTSRMKNGFPRKKELFFKVSTEISNLLWQALTQVGVKETKIQFRRLTTSTFILGAICLPTVDEEAGNTHTHTNTKKNKKKQTAATHRQKPLRGKKKKKEEKSSIFNLTLFCYRAATVAIFLCC